MSSDLSWRIVVGAVLILGALPADAQTPGQIITNQSIVIQRFAAPREPGAIAIDVSKFTPRIPSDEASKLRFTLRSLTVDGPTPVPMPQLAPAWQASIGTTIGLEELNAIAMRIEGESRRAGYLMQAVIPDQDFESGHIVIRLYESYLREVEIKTNAPRLQERLAPYVARLTAMHPIRIKEAERILLLMSDLAGLTVNGIISRPDAPGGGGGMKLEITFAIAAGGLAFDNWGTNEVGPLQLTGMATVNDALGLFDSTDLIGLTVPDAPEKLRFIQIGQEVPLGTHGVHIGYRANAIASRPGADLRPSDVRVAATSGTAFINYPFLRTIARSLFGRIELNLRSTSVDVGGNPQSRDRDRWIAGSLRYVATTKGGSTSLIGAVGQGLGILDASAGSDFRVSRTGVPASYRFGKVDVDMTRPLLTKTTLAFRASGQYARVALPPSVRFNLGGDLYGRAFDGQTASGDSGAAAYVAVSRAVQPGIPFLTDTSLYCFGDYGAVWNRPVDNKYTKATLGSAGLGARGRIANAVDAQLIVAVPWTDTGNLSRSGVRVLFQFARRF